MDLPVRKPNRLTEYDYSQNGAYFVTICTQDRKPILSKIVGDGAHDVPMVALTNIGEIVRKYIISSNRINGITVDKYMIMPNHIHLIVLVDKTDTISYYDHVIRNQQDYNEIWEYIENNPQKWLQNQEHPEVTT